jgi:hypothetical protein
MPWVGFEPTIPAFKWAKTFHASDRTASVIGRVRLVYTNQNEDVRKKFSIFYITQELRIQTKL